MRHGFAASAFALALGCAFALSPVMVVRVVSADPGKGQGGAARAQVRPVKGTATDMLTTAIVHSTKSTPTGKIETSTVTVELAGDLTGRVLYQPTSVLDNAKGTLVNTGRQVFSGTVLGSAPVLLYDDAFRFEVDLKTGNEKGDVHLTRSLAGPKVRCELRIAGISRKGADGNPIGDYTGECTFDKE